MAEKGTAEILKLVELLKNGLAGVCLFLAGHNLWPLDCAEEGSRIEPSVRQQLEDKLEAGLESSVET